MFEYFDFRKKINKICYCLLCIKNYNIIVNVRYIIYIILQYFLNWKGRFIEELKNFVC